MAPVPCYLEPVRPGQRRVRLTVEYPGAVSPRKQLEGPSSEKGEARCTLTPAPGRSGKCTRPVNDGRGTLAPGSGHPRADRCGCGARRHPLLKMRGKFEAKKKPPVTGGKRFRFEVRPSILGLLFIVCLLSQAICPES